LFQWATSGSSVGAEVNRQACDHSPLPAAFVALPRQWEVEPRPRPAAVPGVPGIPSRPQTRCQQLAFADTCTRQASAPTASDQLRAGDAGMWAALSCGELRVVPPGTVATSAWISPALSAVRYTRTSSRVPWKALAPSAPAPMASGRPFAVMG